MILHNGKVKLFLYMFRKFQVFATKTFSVREEWHGSETYDETSWKTGVGVRLVLKPCVMYGRVEGRVHGCRKCSYVLS